MMTIAGNCGRLRTSTLSHHLRDPTWTFPEIAAISKTVAAINKENNPNFKGAGIQPFLYSYKRCPFLSELGRLDASHPCREVVALERPSCKYSSDPISCDIAILSLRYPIYIAQCLDNVRKVRALTKAVQYPHGTLLHAGTSVRYHILQSIARSSSQVLCTI